MTQETADNAAKTVRQIEQQMSFAPLREMVRRLAEWFEDKDRTIAFYASKVRDYEAERTKLAQMLAAEKAHVKRLEFALRGGNAINDNAFLLETLAKEIDEMPVSGNAHKMLKHRSAICRERARMIKSALSE